MFGKRNFERKRVSVRNEPDHTIERLSADCHVHLFMNGVSYREAVKAHQPHPDERLIRRALADCREAGITFLRDGGDFPGVSLLAKKIAPEYGIDLRSPAFAIHKKGHYGSIVGRPFTDLKEYRALVLEARREGADFIKIMTSGIMDLDHFGVITDEPLTASLVKEMVHIAHEEGMAVMSHTNGDGAVRAALEAGVDSLEHGNYMEEDTVDLLASSDTIWVPTLVTVRNLTGSGRYPDEVLKRIADHAAGNLVRAYHKGAALAVGSDAGAHMVFHARGTKEEEKAFFDILGTRSDVLRRLLDGEAGIRARFSPA